MSTRSHIVKKLAEDKYISIYCHWDGYIDGVGKVLQENYTTEELVDKLLALGDLSILGATPIDDPSLWDPRISDDGTHCRSYRGRGDTHCEARETNTLDRFMHDDYTYVWENGVWHAYNWDEYLGELKNLVSRTWKFEESVLKKTEAIHKSEKLWNLVRAEILATTELTSVYLNAVGANRTDHKDDNAFNDDVQVALTIIEKYYNNL